QKFASRLFYQHNPQVTLMRTTPEECAELGRILGRKANACTAPVTVLIPERGISVISAVGGPFYDPLADRSLFGGLKGELNPYVSLIELDANINDEVFGRACAEALLQNIKKKP